MIIHKLTHEENTMRNIWNDVEIEILRQQYPNTPKDEITKVLSRRNWESIKTKAKELKIKRNFVETKNMWSKEELLILEKMYQNSEKDEILKKINRSWETIQCRACSMRLKRKVFELLLPKGRRF